MSETAEGGSAPQPADPDLDETGYATLIEDAFIAERGTPFLVSSKDWGLIRVWREGGIPVHTVVRAVREAFEKRRARGQIGKISSLAYCADAVAVRWEMERRGLVGKETGAPAAGADAPAIREILGLLASGLGTTSDRLTSGEAREDFLRRVIGMAAAADESGRPSEGSFEEIFIPDLRKPLLSAASKIEAISADLPFEEIEEKLSTIEATLVRAGLKAMNPSLQGLVESRVDAALGDVGALAPHVVERMRRALTRREVRALVGFPPITLLHG